MSKTSVWLPEDLKQYAVAAAKSLGVTPQDFIINAIRQAVDAAKEDAQFIAEAKAAREDILQTGTRFDAETVYARLQDRVANAQRQEAIRRCRGKLRWEGDLDSMRIDGPAEPR